MFGRSNDNDDKKNKDVERNKEEALRRVQRRIDDSRIFRQLMSKLMIQLQNSPRFQEDSSVLKDYQSTDYAAERQIILSINAMGMTEGICMGIVTFVFLRRGPKVANTMVQRFVNKTKNNTNSGGGGYQLDKLDKFHQQTTGGASYQQQKPESQFSVMGAIFGGLKLGLDISASLLIAASTSTYFMNKNEIGDKIASIPFIEGKSMVCDEFCTTIQQEVKNHPNELWETTEDFSLKAFYKFNQSCYIRQAYQRKLREEQGLSMFDDNDNDNTSSSSSIAIPMGGIPKDFIAQFDEEGKDFSNNDGYFNNNNNNNRNGYDTFGNNNNDTTFGGDDDRAIRQQQQNNWGERMVSDREEDDDMSSSSRRK